FEELPDGHFRVAGDELEPDEVLVERGGREGWAVASADGVTVALDLGLDDDLLLEGEAYELIHRVNSLRKDEGFELTDRIVLTVPEAQRELVGRHRDWIAREVLATEIRVSGDELKLEKSKATARSARRSSTGSLKLTSSCTGACSQTSAPRAANHAQTSATSRSGADAPDVRPPDSHPSSQLSSMPRTSSTTWAGVPSARATSA